MKRADFLNKAMSIGGLDSATAERAASDWEQENGAFEDSQPEKQGHWLDALLPTFSEEAKKPLSLGSALKMPVKAALDIESIPTRAAATLRGQKFSDPNAYFLKPEVEKAKEVISGKTSQDPGMEAFGIFSNYDPRETEKITTELSGATLSDPTLIGGAVRKGGGMLSKKLGTRIEKSVLGKGSKRILKDQGQTLAEATEGALKHGLGGDMATVIDKSQDIIDDLEENISRVTKGYQGPKKVNIEDRFNVAKKYIADHPELFATNRPEVEKALDIQQEILKSYGLAGDVSVDQAQQIKRWMKVKGVPTQTSPAQQDAVFGIRMAFADAVREIVPEIDQYNQTYREIMPALKIAVDRLPTEQARDILGLGTIGMAGIGGMLSGGVGMGRLPMTIAGGLLKKGSTSGKSAQHLYDLGTALSGTSISLPTGGASVGIRNILER